jgi:hypothetical protein
MIIIALSLATLSICGLLLVSFSRDYGNDCKSIDLRDTMVVAWVYRGSMTFAYGTFPDYQNSPASWLPQDEPFYTQVSSAVRTWRQRMLHERVLAEPVFSIGSNATRFGYTISTKLPVVTQRTKNSKRANRARALPMGYVVFPLWCPLILLAAYPTIAFIRGPLRRRHRRKRNQCIHCGYTLTGLPDPRCPECGLKT